MSKTYCILHKKKHEHDSWRTSGKGWYCTDFIGYPEMTTESIREGRKEFAKSILQSHRGGELSKEFVENYPKKTKEWLDAGVITKGEIQKAKYIWKDLPNYNNLHKSK